MHLRDELLDAAHTFPYLGQFNVRAHPSAVIDASAILFPGVFIGPGVVIGPDCVIGPGASIGAPGFGYDAVTVHAPSCALLSTALAADCSCVLETRHLYRTHTAGVTIERDVHIGANANIAQGRHRPTVIREGARIDALVHVGHNVEIGRNALVVALSMLGGTSEVGDGAHVASATVRDHVSVGAGALAGLGSVVVRDVPAGETWAGVPARRMVPKPPNRCPHITACAECNPACMCSGKCNAGDDGRSRFTGLACARVSPPVSVPCSRDVSERCGSSVYCREHGCQL